MVQIGRSGTARRLFEKLKKNSQKPQNSNFKILVHHFLRVSPMYSKKIDSIRTKITEEIHLEVCPYRHNASMDATPPSSLHLLRARYDIGALQRGTFKNSIWRVHKFGMERVRKLGSWHVRNSELGTKFSGHSELGAFGPGVAIGP